MTQEVGNHTEEWPAAYTTVQAGADLTLEAKAALLDIDADLFVRALVVPSAADGSLGLLAETPGTPETVESCLVARVHTVTQELTEDFLSSATPAIIAAEGLATHVVTALTYGASATVCLAYDRQPTDSLSAIKAALTALLASPVVATDSHAYVNATGVNATILAAIRVSVHADVAFFFIPVSVEESIAAVKTLTTSVTKGGGRGIPLLATLAPLCRWHPDLPSPLATPLAVTAVDELSELFDAYADVHAYATSLIARARSVPFSRGAIDIGSLLDLLETFLDSFRARILLALPDVRAGTVSLRSFITAVDSTPFRPTALLDWLERKDAELTAIESYATDVGDAVVRVETFVQIVATLTDPAVHTVLVLVVVPGTDGTAVFLDVLHAYVQAPGTHYITAVPQGPSCRCGLCVLVLPCVLPIGPQCSLCAPVLPLCPRVPSVPPCSL